jgi:eukaryotic-like serine/threonine-protein kinase
MGAVYRARDLELGVDVAIKVLKSELAENAEAIHRFLREARTAGAVIHQNVIRIRDAGVESESGHLYIVMELLDGQTAETALDQRGPFPLDEVLRIATCVAAGLAAAHRAGIIHRDLKPANVFLTRKGDVKLIDFGIAKAAGRGDGSVQLTTPGIVLGTPNYLSPEQARGESDLDPRADVYALGVVMYELLCGETPFERPGYMQVLSAICSEEPRDLGTLIAGLPEPVLQLIRRAMSRRREDRFGSAAEMLAALEAIGPSDRPSVPIELRRRAPADEPVLRTVTMRIGTPSEPDASTDAPVPAPESITRMAQTCDGPRLWAWSLAFTVVAAIGLALAASVG